ncbi:dTDP-4-amino-4,6-dideoxygalactose transaminase [Actinokineospora globicatena]|uniref:dTDP-4-amino-4,6-dideoxygalactose transaminase n=1 Tax=Actinokineospora globicatena TaxID=103729 RepID=UPI0020A3A986|nr:dTDP-4-amino-4,6-dideoxygalactose transaminase [Actinokineospora globicatena]MCP2303961.1 dTDP-4-amino-4,6-dideoxygalactose transaminase [Actinokineospora globicatena]GLW78877.1 dTDP-4-amino-4,6-dideoxy-D-glucose transaminase [Actinokineospora globicatena]GLW86710.1 dTDP-4-amino-4,6-dideoxy-D-glucose transaminase [Actinokineospora globicatena]
MSELLTERPPFTEPHVAPRQWEYVRDALENGKLDGNGPYTKQAAAVVRRVTGATEALLTPSCTHALEMAAIALDIEPGDEVIVPAFSYAPTACAFALRGAKLVFVDSHPDTLNVRADHIAAAVTDRTKAIVVLHYAGVPCEMDPIMTVAREHGLAVVEDSAQAFGSTYRGRPTGSFGRFAALSFHATKNVHCAKGGALLVNDPADVDRARIIQDRGTDRHHYFQGLVKEYQWVGLGSSSMLNELLAALLAAQLETFDEVQARRGHWWNTYDATLPGWARDNGVATPYIPAHTNHSAHLYYLVLPTEDAKDALLDHLARRGLTATIHYLALHDTPAGRRFGRRGPGGCAVAEALPRRLIRLPMHVGMAADYQRRVIEAITDFRP